MKKFNKNLLLTTSAFSLVLGLSGPLSAFAATSPALGGSSTYGITSSTYTNSLNAGLETAITGDVCYTTPPGTAPVSISGATVVPCAPARETERTSALADVNSQACTSLGTNVVLSGTFTPGCYSSSGTMDIVLGTTVTLSGSGTYIFRPGGAITTGANSKVVLANGASSCNVFWASGGATTLGANSVTSATPTFVGTILNPSAAVGVSLGHFANLNGRVLASNNTVTTDSNTINSTCIVSSVVSSGGSDKKIPPEPPTLTVIKHVINRNGGTAVASDSSIAVKIYGKNVAGSPAFGQENGRIYQLAETGTTTVSELPMAGYNATFSGDCNSKGEVYMDFGDRKTCTITNNDIALVPPLINVTKVPTPLALPGGAGTVTYNYLVTNLGTVGMANITVTDDKCANVTYLSGDVNGDLRLGITETWAYRCATTLATTTTNIVTATGRANGFTASDVAEATVVVGLPLVPPLIHVVKWPSTFLLPAGGGPVTYYYFVTNPGTEPLNNVTITDDKCAGLPAQVVGHPGDLNKNNLLDSNETWNFTCQTNLTQTTTNIGTATGHANGFTAVDLSPATVVVASPKLPNTGFGPDEGSISWAISMLAGIFAASTLFYFVRRKQTN